MSNVENSYTLVSERLKRLRETETTGKKRKNMSQTELAEALNLSEATIKRYETNNPTLGKTTLEHIARFFKTTVDYLTGVTDIKNPLLYYRSMEEASIDGLVQYENDRLAGIEKLKALFDVCGYQYESIDGSVEYDFGGLNNEQSFPGPHKLIDPEGLNDDIYFSDKELENLKRLLSDAIAFECFRIKRGRDKKDGNS